MKERASWTGFKTPEEGKPYEAKQLECLDKEAKKAKETISAKKKFEN